MHVLNAQGGEKPRPARSAWQQLENESFREEQTMFNELFTRRSRPAWRAVGVVVVLAVALAFPQVRALAVDFLGLFRVQQVEFVQVDADSPVSYTHLTLPTIYSV